MGNVRQQLSASGKYWALFSQLLEVFFSKAFCMALRPTRPYIYQATQAFTPGLKMSGSQTDY